MMFARFVSTPRTAPPGGCTGESRNQGGGVGGGEGERGAVKQRDEEGRGGGGLRERRMGGELFHFENFDTHG